MIQKLEKLIDVAHEALTLYIDEQRAKRGEALPLKEGFTRKDFETGGTCAPVSTEKAPKATRARKEKLAPMPVGIDSSKIPGSPFGTEPAPEVADAAPLEDQVEAKRRCQEVMGLFIRRYLKATPTGLERAKNIMRETCGRTITALEDLKYEDHAKLIPVFEAALDEKAA